MSHFNKSVMTNRGLELLSRTFSGEIVMEFVKMEAGCGTYSDSEKEESFLQEREGLKEKQQESYFSSKEIINGNCIALKALLSNELIEEGYYITEIGVYAKEQGADDATAILYSIAVAEIADYMPEYNGIHPAQIIQEYHATVNRASKTIIKIENSAVALAEDLNAHIGDMERHVQPGERESWNEAKELVDMLYDLGNIEQEFYETFTRVSSKDPTAMTEEDINAAISTEWNGESSEDMEAMSAEDVESAISTEWNGESSEDMEAMSAEDVEDATRI